MGYMLIICLLTGWILCLYIFYLHKIAFNPIKPLCEVFLSYDKAVELKIQDLNSNGFYKHCKQLSNKQLIQELKDTKKQISIIMQDKSLLNRNQNLILNSAKAVVIENVIKEKGMPDWVSRNISF